MSTVDVVEVAPATRARGAAAGKVVGNPSSADIFRPAPAAHPLHELMWRRFSPRAFCDRLLAPEHLASVFEAARWAPSSRNEQPWSFVLAPRDGGAAFERLLACLSRGNRAWARHAPLLALALARPCFAADGSINPHARHDLGLAVAQLVLQAVAFGIHARQIAGFDAESARAACAVPAECEPVSVIALGYPGRADRLSDELRARERAERQRRPLQEFVFIGTHGRPAALDSAASGGAVAPRASVV